VPEEKRRIPGKPHKVIPLHWPFLDTGRARVVGGRIEGARRVSRISITPPGGGASRTFCVGFQQAGRARWPVHPPPAPPRRAGGGEGWTGAAGGTQFRIFVAATPGVLHGRGRRAAGFRGRLRGRAWEKRRIDEPLCNSGSARCKRRLARKNRRAPSEARGGAKGPTLGAAQHFGPSNQNVWTRPQHLVFARAACEMVPQKCRKTPILLHNCATLLHLHPRRRPRGEGLRSARVALIILLGLGKPMAARPTRQFALGPAC
jgi:hypothetical protein